MGAPESIKKLTQINTPLGGDVKFELSSKKLMQNLVLDLRASKGSINLPHLFKTPFPVTSITIKGMQKKNSLHLSTLALENTYGQFSATAELTFLPSLLDLERIDINLQGKAENVLIDNFKHIWPSPLGSVPHQWVTTHLSNGRVPLATTDLHVTVVLKPEINLTLKKLTGEIDVEGTSVQYMKDMPPVKETSGKARYTQKNLFITLNAGTINRLQISKGTIHITDMHVIDQNIDIDLDILGPLHDAMVLINEEPLQYARKNGIDPQNVAGDSKIHLNLKFPLEIKSTPDLVKAEVQADLKEVSILHLVDHPHISLTKGTLNLTIKDDKMRIEGQANLNHVPSKLISPLALRISLLSTLFYGLKPVYAFV